jgi:hypothetical protein
MTPARQPGTPQLFLQPEMARPKATPLAETPTFPTSYPAEWFCLRYLGQQAKIRASTTARTRIIWSSPGVNRDGDLIKLRRCTASTRRTVHPTWGIRRWRGAISRAKLCSCGNVLPDDLCQPESCIGCREKRASEEKCAPFHGNRISMRRACQMAACPLRTALHRVGRVASRWSSRWKTRSWANKWHYS